MSAAFSVLQAGGYCGNSVLTECCLSPGLSACSGECPRPKPRVLDLIWWRRCGCTTGSPTAARRRPSVRSWPWTPTPGQPIVSTLCSRMVPPITRRAATPHPVRCRVRLSHSCTGGRTHSHTHTRMNICMHTIPPITVSFCSLSRISCRHCYSHLLGPMWNWLRTRCKDQVPSLTHPSSGIKSVISEEFRSN